MEKQWRSLRLILFTDFSDQAPWTVEEVNFTPKQKEKYKDNFLPKIKAIAFLYIFQTIFLLYRFHYATYFSYACIEPGLQFMYAHL